MSDFIGKKCFIPYRDILRGTGLAMGTILEIRDNPAVVLVSIPMSYGNIKVLDYPYGDVIVLGPVGELLYT